MSRSLNIAGIAWTIDPSRPRAPFGATRNNRGVHGCKTPLHAYRALRRLENFRTGHRTQL